jgi:hypothetical protein
MISKNILPSNFTYEDEYGNVTSREEIYSVIDRWKSLLIERGAKRGNSLGVSLVMVSINHLALVIAAGEMGMRLVLLDKPICQETIPATKAAIFAPIDFHVLDTHLEKNAAYLEMVHRYCTVNIMENEILEHSDEVTNIFGTEDDVYLCGSTSGTTGQGQIVEFTQKDCLDLALRNVNVFGFTEHSVVCHTRNMHHVSCMLTFMLPSLMVAKKHYYYNIYHDADGLFEFMKRKRVDQVFFGSHFVVEDMIASDVVFEVTPKINLSGYTVPEEYIVYCKKHNVEFMSHYGSVDTGIPLLLNHVTEDSEYIPNWLGREPDSYYNMIFDLNWRTTVSGPTFKSREMSDYISPRPDGTWLYLGRLEKNVTEEVLREVTGKDLTVIDNHIVFWEDCNFSRDCKYHIHHLDKKTWTTETKINLHQLRYYLKILLDIYL